jgi:hypothetical protein
MYFLVKLPFDDIETFGSGCVKTDTAEISRLDNPLDYGAMADSAVGGNFEIRYGVAVTE